MERERRIDAMEITMRWITSGHNDTVGKQEIRKKKKKRKSKGYYRHFNLLIYQEKLFYQTFYQNSNNSTSEAAPSEEPEPKLFFMEPEPCQIGPKKRRWLCAFAGAVKRLIRPKKRVGAVEHRFVLN